MLRPALTPAPIVVFPEDGEDVQGGIDRWESRVEDAYWRARVRGRFSWQLFTDWWAARRWVVPRDVRRS